MESNRRATGSWLLLLAAVTLALYGASVAQPFTSDDYHYLYHCRRLSGIPTLAIFHPAVQGIVLPPFYRPLSVIAFALAPSEPAAAAFALHAGLLALRGVTLLLLLLLGSRIFGSVGWGGLAALLFAVSPWTLEPVVWPAAISDSLLLGFLLAAVLVFAYLGEAEAMSPPRQAAAAALTVLLGLLGLASKETSVLLPVLLLCLPARRLRAGRAAIAALFLAEALYVALRLWMQANVPRPEAWDYTALLHAPGSAWWWPALVLYPGVLAAGPFPSRLAILIAQVLLWLAVYALVRSRQGLGRPWLLFVAALILLPPTFHAVQLSPRYAYLPVVGLAILTAATARLGWQRSRWLAATGLAALVIFNGAFARFGAREWRGAADQCETFARFLASRPVSEQTVLVWVPYYRITPFLGQWRFDTLALDQTIYPAWVKAVRGRGEQAVPLANVDGPDGQFPGIRLQGPDVVEVRVTPAPKADLRPAAPSFLTDYRAPPVNTCVEVLERESLRLVMRLKRAPDRRFFALTASGWREL